MDLEKLNLKIEQSNFYQFMQKHKRVINIIQGFFIISLLISINIYVYKDHFIKKQIAENCGYVDSTYKCICEKHYAENWEDLRDGKFNLNITGEINATFDG
jgi:hypothetical protein